MISFNDFIAEDYYYHGTTPENAKHIMKHGFDSSKSKYKGQLFLTKSHGEASKYSKIANNGKLGTVLRVHKDHLDPKNITSDHSGIVQYSGKIHPDHVKQV